MRIASDLTGAATGAWFQPHEADISIQGIATCTSGNVSASYDIEVSNDGVTPVKYGNSITIASGASPQGAITQIPGVYQFVRVKLTALTGTGAKFSAAIASGGPR